MTGVRGKISEIGRAVTCGYDVCESLLRRLGETVTMYRSPLLTL